MFSVSRRNKVQWIPSAFELPTHHTHRPPLLTTLLVLGFALGVLAVFLAGAVGAYLTRGFLLGPFLAMCPILLGSLGLTIYGVGRLFHSKTITLRYNMVEYRESYFFRTNYWREPLFHYEGVEKRSQHLTHGGEVSARTEFELVLKHPNGKREVSLFLAHARELWEEASLAFSQLLNLPVLEVSTPVLESLPLHQRETDLPEFGNRIWIESVPDAHVVRHKRLWSSWPSSLGIIFTGFLYLSSSANLEGAPGEVPLSILLGFFSVFFLIFILQVFSEEELVVSDTSLCYRVRYPWGLHTRKTLARKHITKIIVNADTQRMHLPSAVRIEGQEGIIHFGRYSGDADKIKLRDFLHQHVAVEPSVSHLKEA